MTTNQVILNVVFYLIVGGSVVGALGRMANRIITVSTNDGTLASSIPNAISLMAKVIGLITLIFLQVMSPEFVTGKINAFLGY